MSVIVVGKFNADPKRLAAVFHDQEKDVIAVSEDAKSRGALHHRFAVDDGQVLVVDEWESAEAFHRFFNSQETIPELMRAVGVQGEPEFSIYPVIDTPDQF
jgi:heme-degrading monooxygenase HmoA